MALPDYPEEHQESGEGPARPALVYVADSDEGPARPALAEKSAEQPKKTAEKSAKEPKEHKKPIVESGEGPKKTAGKSAEEPAKKSKGPRTPWS
eukprot:3347685-Alexandrium_andersonii.AAC.1